MEAMAVNSSSTDRNVQATATSVSSKAAAVVDFLTSDDDETNSEDEFETFRTSDAPEFQATVLLSVVFTFLYLPDVKGLALDDTARNFFDAASGDVTLGGLSLSWTTLFQIFMFNLFLSTAS